MKITKEFIKDLKKADNVSVRIEDDTATITTCIKEKVNHKTGWIKPEIKTEHNGIKAYLPAKFHKAWFWDMYKELYGFDTLQHILKPGDEISFQVSVNNNGYLDKAMIPSDAWAGKDALYHSTYHNLYHEVLSVSITRKDRLFIKNLHIADQISVDNSARMLS